MSSVYSDQQILTEFDHAWATFSSLAMLAELGAAALDGMSITGGIRDIGRAQPAVQVSAPWNNDETMIAPGSATDDLRRMRSKGQYRLTYDVTSAVVPTVRMGSLDERLAFAERMCELWRVYLGKLNEQERALRAKR